MIKILKSGKKSMIITCKNPECGCVFSFEKEDVRSVEQSDWYGKTGVYKDMVNCPECGWALHVKVGDK